MNKTAAGMLALALALAPGAALAHRDDHHRSRGSDPLAPIDLAGQGTLGGERITSGTLTITGFALDEAQSSLVAIAVLSARSASHGLTNQTVRIPVLNGATLGAPGGVGTQQFRPPACDVATLVLDELHLDLLGVVVDLNRVVLAITAQPGAGNLLGNLLCAVLGLLDGAGTLAQILQTLGTLNTLTALLGTL